jgi:hypothetical protein
MTNARQFGSGALVGMLGAVLAIVLSGAVPGASLDPGALQAWIGTNLGTSLWLFTAILVAFIAHMTRLSELLQAQDGDRDQQNRIARLDQITDVWIQLFVGVGVIWTAIGMRDALMATLGDGTTPLASGADSVLRQLVDGGILLALSTTIVGGIGSYLMRLAKTSIVGANLYRFYARERDQQLERLVLICRSIECRLVSLGD